MRARFGKLWADSRSLLHKEWLLVALIVSCLLLGCFFGKVGSEVLEGELSRADHAIRAWLQAHRSHATDVFFTIATYFGTRELLAPLAAFIAWRLFRGKMRLIVLLAMFALGVAEVVSILKRGFQIVRPAGGVSAGFGFSFPSGHAAGSMAVAVALSWIAIRRRVAPAVVVPVAAVVVFLVGLSRLYLDFHWASDVVGGWIVGAAFGVGCCALYEWLHRPASAFTTSDSRRSHPELE